ncbi:MAG TPA: HAMP domain-containing sensor histidine kinase [Terriglobales bacterium]|nr:HAMP domain-containing sensor histidine kinase [Terriglobales bacterium]
MANLFDKLPTILVLAVLVGIFIALRRHVKSSRLALWTTAWGLVFSHFIFQAFEGADGGPALLFLADQGALQMSALFFIASLTSFFEDRKLTLSLLALTGLPVLINVWAIAFDCSWRAVYMACYAAIFFAPVLFIARVRKLTWKNSLWMPVILAAGVVSIFRAWHHQYIFGFLSVLTLGFGMPGFLYWRRYQRWSPGVFTSVGGFLLWGLVFPLGYLQSIYLPNVKLNPELWNTPKFFVAFGMILTLLEEKSNFLKSVRERERLVNLQMQRFAAITSRLLSGVEVMSLCQEIAVAISETSTFRRVIILLSTDGKTLFAAGYAGLDAATLKSVNGHCENDWRMGKLVEICGKGAILGESARWIKGRELAEYPMVASSEEYPPESPWQPGDKVFVPLQSSRAFIGCISMDDPLETCRVTAEELSKVELLAGDLAVTVDNAALHRQLVRSEKLAAIGQLVAGVAHELNNPLTSICGYSELMTDEIIEGPARQKLDKMIREAQRMRRIIENLLRFARQNNLERKSADVEALVLEVLALRDYHLRENNVAVQIEIEPELPQVALDEDKFKQILLNLLNNSIDALEGSRNKRIHVEAMRRNQRVVLHFDDNGPGFAEPGRVFDPFYTTKPVGKGTGLGLSICYGIVKEHGGDVQAVNLTPRGARVALELPLLMAAEENAAAMVSAQAT